MLTDVELRQAAFALQIINERGDSDVLALILRKAGESPENRGMGMIAGRLSSMLRVPRERCDEAEQDVFGRSRQREAFCEIVNYAIQLIGPCRELTGQSHFVPFNQDSPTRPAVATPAARPAIRIVADSQREGVA